MTTIGAITHINEIGIRKINEDRIVVDTTRNVFGVFDGASSVVPYTSLDGKTGGYIAASVAADTFANSNLALDATALLANERLAKVQSDANIDVSKNANRFGTTAAAVKVNDNTIDLLQIGDSIVIVADAAGNATVPLGYYDHDIVAMRKWRRFADEGHQNIRELVWDDIVAQREAANHDYGVLNGDERLKGHLKTTSIALGNIATILILTDGMFLPKADPDSYDNWNAYIDVYRESGLNGLFRHVRDIEDTDPTLTKYPRFKLHDDSSAIAIDFIH